MATIDLSNVDLQKYKYFKYPQQNRYHHLPYSQRYQNSASSIMTTENNGTIGQKVKAIGVYFTNVLFGNNWQQKISPYVFDPNFGKKWQNDFQRQFGHRGENLIALLGKGYSRNALVYYGAIDKDF